MTSSPLRISYGYHVHLLVQYPPALAISTHVQRLKGRTAYAARREYAGACVRARMRGHLWSPSYFAVLRRGTPVDHQANTSMSTAREN